VLDDATAGSVVSFLVLYLFFYFLNKIISLIAKDCNKTTRAKTGVEGRG